MPAGGLDDDRGVCCGEARDDEEDVMMLIPLHRRWQAGTVDTGRPCAYAAFDEADPPETHQGVMVVTVTVDEITDGWSVVRAHPVAAPPTGHSHWQGGCRADIEGVRHFLRGAPGDATEVVVMNYTVPVAGPLPHDPTSVAFVVGRRYLEHVSSDDGSSWHAAYEVVARSAKFVTVARVGSSLEPERIKVRTDDGTEMLRLRGWGQLHATAVEDA